MIPCIFNRDENLTFVYFQPDRLRRDRPYHSAFPHQITSGLFQEVKVPILLPLFWSQKESKASQDVPLESLRV